MTTGASRFVQSESTGTGEADLVERLQAGDEAAYEHVVRTYAPRMLVVARRFLNHEQDAQDAVQDALLSAFRSIGSFAGKSSLGTWLHRIVVNAALARLRSGRRRTERSIDELVPRFLADGHMEGEVAAWAVTLDRAVAERETRRVVRGSIEQLPESYRAVLLLRDIEGQSTAETAEVLGLNEGAVKTRLHRARQALRTLLDPYMRGLAP
jgi:RNA polymerase sigma-70 factor (ECF subfamily)